MGSNAHAFKEWANSEGLTRSASLDQLKGSVIGIDAEDYLQSFSAQRREPLLPALGGLPFSLDTRVDEDVRNFREAGIEPIFIFNGLELACKDRASVLKESRKMASILSDAWSIYDLGKGEEAVNMFGRASNYRNYHIARSLQIHLIRQGVQVLTAPFVAAAQLTYMLEQGVIDGVAGSASCLLFGANKVVTNFDTNGMTFSWVELSVCLSKLGLARDQFIDLCLLSGSSILPTMPDVDADSTPVPKMQAARTLMNRFGFDGNAVCLQANDENYQGLFHKARSVLKHPVLLTSDGKVEPKNHQSAPHDIHLFAGQRLPEEICYHLSRGLIGSRVLNWRARTEIVETSPLDSGNSQTYHDLVQEKLRPLRAQALALMTHSLHRWYQVTDVELICWWNENNKIPLNLSDRAEATKSAESWHVKVDSLPQSGNIDISASPLLYAISTLANDGAAKKTVTPRASGTGAQLRDSKDIGANVIWRFLTDRRYVNADHTLSAWGKALKAALDRANTDGKSANESTWVEMEQSIFMALELLRFGILNATQMFTAPAYSQELERGSETDKAHVLLVSRIACLGRFSHANIGFTGPLSRNLLAYQQLTSAVRGTMRDLLEMHACHMLLSGAVDRNLESMEYSKLGANLPFVDEPDIGLALVVKSHLNELLNEPNKRTDIVRWFNHAQDIPGDLRKAWKLWDAVNAGIQAADGSIVNSETKKTFRETDEWLSKMRDIPHAPNGTA